MSLRGWWGFDSCATQKYPEFANVIPGTAVGRDGVALHATTWDGNNVVTMNIPGGNMTGCILGYAINWAGVGGLNSMRVAEFDIGTTVLGYVGTIAIGDARLAFYSSAGSVLATTGNVIIPGVWQYIEVLYIPHATAGSVIIRINEVEVMNYTGPTTPATTTFDTIRFNARNVLAGVDDMYLMDFTDETATAGRPNNTFLGDVKVAHSIPTADGTTTTLTPSTAGPHFGLVDETPPNTTDYVSALGGSLAKDTYQMTDLPAIAVVVYGVRVGAYAAKTDAGAASLQTLVRESDGTESASVAQPLSTSYTGYFGPFRKAKAAGGVFTPADINAIQAGVQVA